MMTFAEPQQEIIEADNVGPNELLDLFDNADNNDNNVNGNNGYVSTHTPHKKKVAINLVSTIKKSYSAMKVTKRKAILKRVVITTMMRMKM